MHRSSRLVIIVVSLGRRAFCEDEEDCWLDDGMGDGDELGLLLRALLLRVKHRNRRRLGDCGVSVATQSEDGAKSDNIVTNSFPGNCWLVVFLTSVSRCSSSRNSSGRS